jgi:hypothetical protein
MDKLEGVTNHALKRRETVVPANMRFGKIQIPRIVLLTSVEPRDLIHSSLLLEIQSDCWLLLGQQGWN